MSQVQLRPFSYWEREHDMHLIPKHRQYPAHVMWVRYCLSLERLVSITSLTIIFFSIKRTVVASPGPTHRCPSPFLHVSASGWKDENETTTDAPMSETIFDVFFFGWSLLFLCRWQPSTHALTCGSWQQHMQGYGKYWEAYANRIGLDVCKGTPKMKNSALSCFLVLSFECNGCEKRSSECYRVEWWDDLL